MGTPVLVDQQTHASDPCEHCGYSLENQKVAMNSKDEEKEPVNGLSVSQ